MTRNYPLLRNRQTPKGTPVLLARPKLMLLLHLASVLMSALHESSVSSSKPSEQLLKMKEYNLHSWLLDREIEFYIQLIKHSIMILETSWEKQTIIGFYRTPNFEVFLSTICLPPRLDKSKLEISCSNAWLLLGICVDISRKIAACHTRASAVN